MRRSTSLLRVDTVLLLIGAALLIPQFGSGSPSSDLSDGSGVHIQAALRYAKLRLWGDFLEQRQQTMPSHRLPAPSLAEYRAYLSAHGLRRRGDATTLYVLPPLDPSASLGRIRVSLHSSHDPVLLEVAVYGPRKREQTAGRLLVRTDPDGTLTCRIEAGDQLALWSFWPLRPEPLLP